MTELPQPARKSGTLDLLHKGVYLGIALVISIVSLCFALYVNSSNSHKQRQIDKLQAEVATEGEARQAAERNREKEAQQSEEQAHKIRVELAKGMSFPQEGIFKPGHIRTNQPAIYKWDFEPLVATIEVMKVEDQKRLGSTKAKEVWEQATNQADKEAKEFRRAYPNGNGDW